MKSLMKSIVLVASVAISGCNIFGPPAENPAAVLEGTWQLEFDEPGDLEGYTVLLTFDSSGQLTQITAEAPDSGGTANLDVDDTATSDVEGNEVTITVPVAGGTRIFEGTLSEDGNSIDGSLSQELDLPSGDLEVTLPGSDLTLSRLSPE